MKEINILEAIQMPQLMIDMVTPVKDYEKYDFHVGMKCKIDGFPFELMSENGKLSLEAGAIMLTARRRREQEVPRFRCGETIAIIQLFDGYAKAFAYTLPEKVRTAVVRHFLKGGIDMTVPKNDDVRFQVQCEVETEVKKRG